MLHYGLAWHPASDNLGHDLLALAARQHLPRVDFLLDADALDAPLPGLGDEDRVVALIPGNFLASSAHWPPEKHIAPVCVGVHITEEDAWGLPLSTLDGAGLACLRAVSPIGCRDERTVRRLQALDVPHQLTACLTLTLRRPDVPRKGGVVCCDVPQAVISAIREYRADVDEVTHHVDAPCADFQARMTAAEAMLRRYAEAEMVFTRRLHCAMACLAVGTPVMLLYNSQYEDIARFAPMDGMVVKQPMDAFLQQLERRGFPTPWKNPADMAFIRQRLEGAVARGLARSETMPLPIVPQEDAERWREQRIRRMTDSAAAKIHRLENQQYEDLHRKFSLLLREDSAKATLTELLALPQVQKALRKAALDKQLADQPLTRRLKLRWQARHDPELTGELIQEAREALELLGWPD